MAVVHVVVGVIINKKNQVLIAKRANHQHQGNKWEFPGGKVENDESPTETLTRELKEELGIEVQSASHLIDIRHEYTDKTVHLEVFEVRDWQGDAEGREGQPLRWVERSALNQYEFPEANTEILSALSR